MDPEQTFLRVHARLSGMLARLLKPRIRTALEYMSLVVAIALFSLLVVMHVNFVAQPGCSSEFSGTDVTEAHLVQIKINSVGLWAQETLGLNSAESDHQHLSTQSFQIPTVHGDALAFSSSKFWLSLIGTNARKGKGIFKLWRHVKELLELHSRNEEDSSDSKLVAEGSERSVPHECTYTGLPLSAKDSLKAAAVHLWRKWNGHFRTIWRKARDWSCNFCQFWKTAEWHKLLDASTWSHLLQVQGSYLSVVNWLENRSKSYEPTYLYTVEKGYFMLPEGAKSRHNIRTVNISISARNSCFGNRWQQLLVNSFVGYDTILMNSLLTSPGQGYLYNFQTKEFYDLSHLHESAQDSPKSEDYLVSKCGVLMMSLFVFFTTTMSVSFTLRETQSRMLKFTVQLQHHARHRLPTFQLIFIHVIESLVFVPIMIGILFFLFEFYDDQFLAFMVLTLVWLCELFTLISVRTPISMQYYPRFFLLYFLVFHIYFFSYSYGFSYLAFSTMAAFMQHLILYFWNRFEVPALQRFMQQRMQMQQSGVQITSSTIFTSTVHIARLNTANVDPSGQGGSPTTDVAGTNPSSDAQNQVRGPDFQPLAFQQAENVPNPTSMNSIGSLLLWVLGGGPSDGFISLFSMFRDLRDQEQAYVPPTEQGN